MCDTMVVLQNGTRDGSVLFAKNSDREPNEAQEVLCLPSADYPEGAAVQCTYRSIPQARHTAAVLLSKPFWIWGAEMGANEHGVVIGNEAVFTRQPKLKEPALLGMDLLRLALERSATASEALQTIISLLSQYGQGGNCGLTHNMEYDNSYLIADGQEAWVLETAGKEWAAEKVRLVRSISNAITLDQTWDAASPDLVKNAVARGWCRSAEDFHFNVCYSEPVFTYFSDARRRQTCSTGFLSALKGQVEPGVMMRALRSHGLEEKRTSPEHGLTGADVCMHAGYGPIRGSQTTGSLVSRLAAGSFQHWVTGTAAPCTGIFKPVWIDSGLPDLGTPLSGTYDTRSLWWTHERLHRAVLADYAARLGVYQPERDEMEARFVSGALELAAASREERKAFTVRCFAEAAAAEARWFEQVRALPARDTRRFFHRLAWNDFNRQAHLPDN